MSLAWHRVHKRVDEEDACVVVNPFKPESFEEHREFRVR